jgi:hypothetical protein
MMSIKGRITLHVILSTRIPNINAIALKRKPCNLLDIATLAYLVSFFFFIALKKSFNLWPSLWIDKRVCF